MAQTEKEFNKFHEKNMKFANGYYKENGKIPEKFLFHSFLEIKNNSFIKKIDYDSKYKSQIALYKRKFIASSSNHCEGFHRQLNKISKEKKGLEYKLTQLYNKINRRFAKYHLKAVEECQCNENIHKNLVYNCFIPCKHAISEESIIKINYPKLDHSKFINVKNFLELPSKLTSHISSGNADDDLNTEDDSFTIEQIDDALERAHSLLSSYDKELINSDLDIL